MFRNKPVLASILILCAPLLSAAYIDADGNTYQPTTNAHGMALKSPKATIFLGKSCDAFSRVYGKGTWGWANGGFQAKFRKATISFPRQEIDIDVDGRCRL